MDQPISSDPANPRKTDNWYGWPAKDIKPKRDQRAALWGCHSIPTPAQHHGV